MGLKTHFLCSRTAGLGVRRGGKEGSQTAINASAGVYVAYNGPLDPQSTLPGSLGHKLSLWTSQMSRDWGRTFVGSVDRPVRGRPRGLVRERHREMPLLPSGWHLVQGGPFHLP